MKYAWLAGVPLFVASSFSAAQECPDVVADVLAEMRAGSTSMTAEDEALIRAAAGSACVKTLSGRYGSEVPTEAVVSETVVSEATAESASEEAAETAEDDGSFTAGGITFKPMSGSPSKKPYERNRGKDD